MKSVLAYFFVLFLLFSCGEDNPFLTNVETVAPLLLTEVEPDNDEAILEFLRTHSYNADDFLNPSSDFDFVIRVDTIAGDNNNATPLIDQVESATLNVSSIDFGIEGGEENIAHTYYYLIVREGAGLSPTIADSTLLRFEGYELDSDTFDANTTFSWLQLPNTVRGFGNGITNLRAGTAEGVQDNGDGTSTFTDSGIGLIIMPSGLGFFNGTASGALPQYAPLVFSIELGAIVEDTDADNDGIPSILEDLNGNGLLSDDNTDDDLEIIFFPNFIDPDDDNDFVETRDEISIDENGNVIFLDTDGDGIPDHLDFDSSPPGTGNNQ